MFPEMSHVILSQSPFTHFLDSDIQNSHSIVITPLFVDVAFCLTLSPIGTIIFIPSYQSHHFIMKKNIIILVLLQCSAQHSVVIKYLHLGFP